MDPQNASMQELRGVPAFPILWYECLVTSHRDLRQNPLGFGMCLGRAVLCTSYTWPISPAPRLSLRTSSPFFTIFASSCNLAVNLLRTLPCRPCSWR